MQVKNITKNILRYLRIPIYGDKELKISFEFGLVLSQVAKERNVELTNEISVRAENILIKEINLKGVRKTAMNFVPLILAALEISEQNPDGSISQKK